MLSDRGGFLTVRCLICLFITSAVSQETSRGNTGWQKQSVNWQISSGRQIKAIYYPQDQNLTTFENRGVRRPVELRTRVVETESESTSPATSETRTPVYENVVNAPPVNGFIPYVTVAVTDERSDPFDFDTYIQYSVAGDYLTESPESDYAIGIFDTGSSAHVINLYDAFTMGIYDADLITSFEVTLTGAVNDVNALVSQPLGIFTDGLAAIDANTLLVDDSNMVGQSNVAVIIGDIYESALLPTVIGSPLAFFYTTVIENSKTVSLIIDDNDISGPDIRLYQHNSDSVPDYPNKIYLELRPSTAYAIQYLPCFEVLGQECPEGDGEPTTPSVVFGSSFDVPQSLFFATRTDLAHGDRTSQQQHFMFDTGAQITVISESQAASLELVQHDPNFYVEISDVTGSVTIADGYYLDLLEISAIPQWLAFSNVPVVVLDVTSPEGGILDGIIGMNLFVDIDFYIRGGGLYGQEQPYIQFAFLPAGLPGDIAPAGSDGTVNLLDLAAFTQAWLTNPLSPNWNSRADMVSDAVINFHDFAELAEYWQMTVNP